jgi:hypothetical protein
MSLGPTLELHHLAYGARTTWRVGRWAAHIGFWKPVLASAALWLGSGVAMGIHQRAAAMPIATRVHSYTCSGPGIVGTCVLKSDGTGTPMHLANGERYTTTEDLTRPAGTALYAAQVFATLGSVTLVLAMGTGFLTLVGAFKPSRRQKRGTIRGAVREDWRGGKSDAREAKKGLKKAGNAVARRRARQAESGEVADPSWLAAKVLAHADPPKEKKAKRAKKPKAKDERQQLDAEWADEVARIEANRQPEYVAPRLDPTNGPPLAPVLAGATRTEDPQITAWNERAAAIQADTARYLAELQADEHERNGWVGYTPPPAPLAPISVKEDTP